ncbi:hypothetical protein K6T82_19300 [Flavobacterium sp. 17A]|uniref:Uncharacterized protein n=1 Tax=Flavobacterium potami TaxID=2872310 RepID=A0A9X1KRY6_9FLAO|nr:hypothetical protein [Flavobacterium potami]MBZ4036924.1 hypothetical protein [Flavobacterium potami]
MSKQRLVTLTLPLTIILFILFTKWWIVDVIDGSDCVTCGFPLIYKAPAFHTSLAQQFFILEFLVDFLVYFLIVSTLLLLIDKLWIKIKLSKKPLIIIYTIAILLFGIEASFVTVFETSFSIKRDFDIEVKQTGFKFYFSEEERNI